jgi:prepilin peptidase CpaA
VTALELAPLALLTPLALAAAVFDVRTRRIPNALNAAIAVAGLVTVAVLAGWLTAGLALAHFAAALALGMLTFAMRLWGGGDAKFYAASAAWFPLADFGLLIMAISIAGLALVIAWFVRRRFRRDERETTGTGQLPYGVAIAAGAICAMGLTTFSLAA